MSLETTTADEFGRGNVLSAGILSGSRKLPSMILAWMY